MNGMDWTTRLGRCSFGVSLILAVMTFCPRLASGQESDPTKIDFEQKIGPILAAKCYSCHGTLVRHGGLRLDRRDEVLVGGYSQKQLLGGTLATNELYLRVTSNVPAFRMPKGGAPLTADEVSILKRWVEQGALWPESKQHIEPEQPDWFNQATWLNYVDRWVTEVPGFITWLFCMLGLLVSLFLIERYKHATQKEKAWTTYRWSRWLSPLKKFGLVHFLLVVVTMGWILTSLVSRGQAIKAKELAGDLKNLQSAVTRSVPGASSSNNSVYGNPPIPQHPGHKPRLRGEYYRGNCERSPKLFNGGNYRTATLRVSLIDTLGQEVNFGDPIKVNSLSIRFELERPQGTTLSLYGDSIVKGVFLTPQLLTETPTKLDRPVIRLTEIKPDWKWEASVPLNGPNDSAATQLSGLIYVYQGAVGDDNQARGNLHYGIKYDLKLQNLILQPDSEVWLGSLFWTPTLEHPTLGKVPLKEWFNHEPIPEITGVNSTDPVLLGIPEHKEQQKRD
jgi:hypothetical protein